MINQIHRVKVTNRGMITIPSKIRKKLNIVDGKEYFIVEDFDGALMLIPFIDIEKEENRIENSIINKMLNQMEIERQKEIDEEFRK
ncbi:MAG: AbrB/MazE/SpoVT family DNA-binding domain-containing protein [Promethearchaeota archaeon]